MVISKSCVPGCWCRHRPDGVSAWFKAVDYAATFNFPDVAMMKTANSRNRFQSRAVLPRLHSPCIWCVFVQAIESRILRLQKQFVLALFYGPIPSTPEPTPGGP